MFKIKCLNKILNHFVYIYIKVKYPKNQIYKYKKFLNKETKTKKALISYLVDPIIFYPKTSQFSNHGIARCLPRALNELGYIVDIINWKDTSFIPYEKYDLFIAHGAINFDNIYSHLSPSCLIIYLSTGNYWKFNNSQENNRLDDLEKRKGVRLPNDRYISISEDRAHRLSNGIITFGDKSAIIPYNDDGLYNIVTIPNAAYPDFKSIQIKRDFKNARNNFLFFSGSGNVHKGLDLLLEVFSRSNKHLYIMTSMDIDFVKLYEKELKLPNIHLIGWVKMRSQKYYDIMEKCGFIIHPSSSDGSAGSVIEAMQQGLIPIVSKETRIDISDFGFIIEPCTQYEIEKLIRNIDNLKTEDLEKKSKILPSIIRERFSPDVFISNLKKCIEEITNKYSK